MPKYKDYPDDCPWTKKAYTVKKTHIYRALGRDQTWFASAEVAVKLVRELGPDGKKDDEVIQLLKTETRPAYGAGRFKDKLVSIAREKYNFVI